MHARFHLETVFFAYYTASSRRTQVASERASERARGAVSVSVRPSVRPRPTRRDGDAPYRYPLPSRFPRQRRISASSATSGGPSLLGLARAFPHILLPTTPRNAKGREPEPSRSSARKQWRGRSSRSRSRPHWAPPTSTTTTSRRPADAASPPTPPPPSTPTVRTPRSPSSPPSPLLCSSGCMRRRGVGWGVRLGGSYSAIYLYYLPSLQYPPAAVLCGTTRRIEPIQSALELVAGSRVGGARRLPEPHTGRRHVPAADRSVDRSTFSF